MRATGLRWMAVLVPTAVIVLLDNLRHQVVTGVTHPWPEELSLFAGVLLVVYVTSHLLFSLMEKARRREREAETLRSIGMEISSNLELSAILSSVLTRGREILGAECVGVAMAGSASRELVVQTRDAPAPRTVPAPGEAALLWEVMDANEPKEVRRDVISCAGGQPVPCNYCLALPLRMGSQVIGALCAGSARSRPYCEDDRKLAGQMANLASVAVSNALLHQRAGDLATLVERDRIAREMHDSLAQVLGLLSMKSFATRDLLRQGELGRADAELSEMGQVADDAYRDVREAILGLRVSVRTSGQLTDSLDQYLQAFSRQSGVAGRLLVQPGVSFHLSPTAEIQLVRVVQEALTNIRKHARASNVVVKMERKNGQTLVIIEDDGQGFEPGPADDRLADRYGMATMRERLSQIGGQLAIESTPGMGTRVTVAIPVAGEREVGNGEG